MNSSPAPAANYRNSFKAECDRRRKAGLLLTGNTYPYREALGKEGLGGIWDSYEKGWLMPNRAAYDKGVALISGGGKKKAAKSGGVEANDDMPF